MSPILKERLSFTPTDGFWPGESAMGGDFRVQIPEMRKQEYIPLSNIKMRLLRLFAAVAAVALEVSSTFPLAPFKSESRWIKDSTGSIFTYHGINWPGAGESMLPEGLQYQSVQNVVSRVKTSGFNIIRLTFATEMIDQIYNNSGVDISIETAFVNALGVNNGTEILNNVLVNNPSWSQNTTRLQVFDAIAQECSKQGIYVHLDNHMSKAEWCCSFTDGNTWFGDTYFDVDNWKRSLAFMVTYVSALTCWPFQVVNATSRLQNGRTLSASVCAMSFGHQLTILFSSSVTTGEHGMKTWWRQQMLSMRPIQTP